MFASSPESERDVTILRTSQNADKISHYVLALEKEQVPSNIEQLPGALERNPQLAPACRAPRARPATGHEDDPHR